MSKRLAERETMIPVENWEALAGWLEAEWREIDFDAHPMHKGIYEAYTTVARTMKTGPPAEREDRLYRLLTQMLRLGPEGGAS